MTFPDSSETTNWFHSLLDTIMPSWLCIHSTMETVGGRGFVAMPSLTVWPKSHR